MSSVSFAINTSGRKELACPNRSVLIFLTVKHVPVVGSLGAEKSLLSGHVTPYPYGCKRPINSGLDRQPALCHLAPAAFAASDCAESAATFARSAEYAR